MSSLAVTVPKLHVVDQSKVRKPTYDEDMQIQGWRAKALEKMPYMAHTLFRMKMLVAPGLGTFACDASWRTYLDIEFALAQDKEWGPTGLLHEGLHLLFDHSTRRITYGADPNAFNFAGDAELNDDLVQAKVTLDPRDVTPAVLGRMIGKDLPDNQTAEWYYEQIPKKGSTGKANMPGGDGQGQGKGPGQGDPPKFSGCGSASGGIAAPCELDPETAAELGKAASPVSQPQGDAVRFATAAAIRDHASSGRGTVPGSLKAWADMQFAAPQVPWRQMLAAQMKRCVGVKQGMVTFSHRRPSRRTDALRSSGSNVLLPSMVKPIPTAIFVRDTSGSMGEDELEALSSEIKGIAEQIGIRGREFRIIDVDAEAHTVLDYTNAHALQEIVGRGGTDMRVGIDKALELRPSPTVIIVGTDGFTPWPDGPGSIPIIACIVGSPEMRAAAIGHIPDWLPYVEIDS